MSIRPSSSYLRGPWAFSSSSRRRRVRRLRGQNVDATASRIGDTRTAAVLPHALVTTRRFVASPAVRRWLSRERLRSIPGRRTDRPRRRTTVGSAVVSQSRKAERPSSGFRVRVLSCDCGLFPSSRLLSRCRYPIRAQTAPAVRRSHPNRVVLSRDAERLLNVSRIVVVVVFSRFPTQSPD